MSDLRKNLEKQRELEKTYNQYRIDKDRLDLEEAQALRESRRTGRLLTAAGKAASALGKIGASKAGALVTGDLVPDLNLDKYANDSISDEYDTKRLSMNEKALNLRGEIDEVEDQRRIAKDEERIRKEEERKAEKAKKESLKLKNKAAEYDLKARAKAENLVKDKLITDIEKDVIDGDEAVEILEDKGVPDELLDPFRETLGILEDEELQAKTLKELQEKLRLHFIRKRVSDELSAGKALSPELLKALNIEPKESLTKEPETAKIETPAPEKASVGEPTDDLPRYEFKAPNGERKVTGPLTPEAERNFLRAASLNPKMEAKLIEQSK